MRARSDWRDRTSNLLIAVVTLSIVLSGCRSSEIHLRKIALVAPFEGRHREVGYDVVPAARLAIQEFAKRTDHPGLVIELVAYDDRGDADSARGIASSLKYDPTIAAVIGNWLDPTTLSAAPIYQSNNLPLVTYTVSPIDSELVICNLAPNAGQYSEALEAFKVAGILPSNATLFQDSGDLYSNSLETSSTSDLYNYVGTENWATSQFNAVTTSQNGPTAIHSYMSGLPLPEDSSDDYWSGDTKQQLILGFREISLGSEPGQYAVTAYLATWLALKHVSAQYDFNLSHTPVDSLNCNNPDNRVDGKIYLYSWQDGNRNLRAVSP